MARNIQARRKLSELYRRGVEVRFGPNGGKIGRITEPGKADPAFDEPLQDDEVAVWVCPPSPLQRDEALRNAQAAKAKAVIKVKRDEESEEHLTAMAFLAEMTYATLVDYVLEGERDDREREAMRDVLGREEWKDIVDLQDAMRTFDEEDVDSEDPEYVAVMERDREYGRQVNERFMSLTEGAREAFSMVSRQELERRALAKRSELVGAQRFMQEFELQMTYFGVREINARTVLFFESPREFSEQDDVVQDAVKQALGLFISDGTEVKNLFGVESGSESSALPSEPATSESSTPMAATA